MPTSVTPTIPGVSSSYQTDKMIEDLMKLERVPLEKKQQKIETLQDSKKSWLRINAQLSRLESAGKALYGHENPFNNKSAISSDESALSVNASRDAQLQDFSVKIKQLATADKFKTPALPNNYKVPQGRYTFGVGDKTISFNFKGGSLNEFSAALNKRGKDLINSSVVKVTGSTQVLVIESLLEGNENRLKFFDDARKLALETGMINSKPESAKGQVIASGIELSENQKEDVSFPSLSSTKGRFLITYHFESLFPEEEAKITGSQLTNNDGTQQLGENSSNTSQEELQGEDAIIPISGSVTVEDVTVFQAPSLVDGLIIGSNQTDNSATASTQEPKTFEEKWEYDKKLIEQNGNLITFNRISGNQVVKNIPIESQKHQLSFPIDDYLDLQSITFENPFKTKKFVIDSVSIDDGTSRDYTPINPIQTSQNAILEMDGLDVTRPTNKIDDLVYGVTLDLKKATDTPVTVTIKNDVESIKDAIFKFVFDYNKTLESIIVLTSSDEAVINELTYLDEEEKESLRAQLGTMKGDNTLNGLKNRLQTLATSAYKAYPDTKIAILNDMGIGTNVVGGGGFNLSKIRGYLEIDEKKLDQQIAENIEDIKNFFGYDTNEDLIVDMGLGHSMSNYLHSYTAPGGVIATKAGTYDQQVNALKKEVTTLERKLQAKEQEYKVKYGRMEGMIKELQKNSQSINNLNRNYE